MWHLVLRRLLAINGVRRLFKQLVLPLAVSVLHVSKAQRATLFLRRLCPPLPSLGFQRFEPRLVLAYFSPWKGIAFSKFSGESLDFEA